MYLNLSFSTKKTVTVIYFEDESSGEAYWIIICKFLKIQYIFELIFSPLPISKESVCMHMLKIVANRASVDSCNHSEIPRIVQAMQPCGRTVVEIFHKVSF